MVAFAYGCCGSTAASLVRRVPRDRLIEVFTRNADESWTLRDHRAGKARLEAIGCVLDVDTIYANPFAT